MIKTPSGDYSTDSVCYVTANMTIYKRRSTASGEIASIVKEFAVKSNSLCAFGGNYRQNLTQETRARNFFAMKTVPVHPNNRASKAMRPTSMAAI
jgi:hypothetical protein